ncbi:MAG TPA: aminotransferase class V-fold PLP-dependent enzyme, partial [Candidatus Sulfotelmatobacter sp.]|nr:aminotransferase class V-fold PLP-dependent enzyme [Candidatus Sulfotelmatobacter sp.]
MAEQLAYLDYNATAPIRTEAAAAVLAALQVGGNPSSVHRRGRLARKFVEDARDQVAALLGAAARQVIFTSGGTEANNLALNALPVRRLIVSAVEHDSVLSAAAEAAAELEVLPVDHQGVIDLAALEETLAAESGPALVSVMLANNETGVLQPLDRVVALAREQGARVHCDAVQAAGKVPVDFATLGV